MNHYFTKDHFRSHTIKYFVKNLKKYLKQFDDDGLDISNKMKSEFASQIAEKSIKETIPGTTCPKLDKEPDCKIPHKITNILTPWEIKCTTGDSWRGGEYSKRPGYYLLISWKQKEQNIAIFAARLHMIEDDWDKSKPTKNGNKNYYATTFPKKKLLKYYKEGKADILCGDIYNPTYKNGNINNKCVKLDKEEIIINK